MSLCYLLQIPRKSKRISSFIVRNAEICAPVNCVFAVRYAKAEHLPCTKIQSVGMTSLSRIEFWDFAKQMKSRVHEKITNYHLLNFISNVPNTRRWAKVILVRH